MRSCPLGRAIRSDRAIERADACESVTGDDPKAGNDFETPDRIVAEPFDGVQVLDGVAEAVLPPLSVAAVSFTLGEWR